MAIIANLDIVLGAQTTKASKDLNGFGSELRKLRNTVVGLAGAYLSFNAARSAFNNLLAKNEELDTLGKQANLIGDSVLNLKALQVAGELAGDSQEALFEATKKLNLVLGQAATGGKAQREALEGLGLNIQALANQTPVERLFAVGEALKQQGDAALIAKSAAEVFGKQWGAIFNTISTGLGSLQDTKNLLKDLGFAFTPAQLKQIEAANDALTVMKVRFAILSLQTLPVFSAALTVGLRAMEKIVAIIRGFGSADLPATTLRVVGFAAAFGAIVFVSVKFVEASKKIVEGIKAITKATTIAQAFSGPKGWALLAVGAIASAAALSAVEAGFAGINKELAKLEQGGGGPDDPMSQKIKEALALTEQAKEMENAVTNMQEAAENSMRKAVDQHEIYVRQMRDRGEELRKSLRLPIEEFRDDLEELRALADFGAIDQQTARRAVQAAIERLKGSLPRSESVLLNQSSATRGSVEALTPFLQRRSGESIPREILKATEEGNRALNAIENELRRNPPVRLRAVIL